MSAVRRECYSRLSQFRVLSHAGSCFIASLGARGDYLCVVVSPDFRVFAQSQLLIEINRLMEELWKANALNHRKLAHCVDREEVK